MAQIARDGDPTACGASVISGASKTSSNGILEVRLGDPGSHGGAVISASSRTSAEGSLIARIGDIYGCPIHGPNPIAGASPDTQSE